MAPVMKGATDVNADQANLKQAAQELERIARLEGIDEHSPLGQWITALRGGMTVLASVADASAQRSEEFASKLEDVVSSARDEMTELRDNLEAGYRRIESMQSFAEARVRLQEKQLEARQQETVDRLVASVVSGLKDAVFDKLRQRIPLTEGLFYREMRWRAYALVFVAAATLLVSGAGLALFVTWPETQRGRYCLTHGHRDVHKGQDWCELTPLTDPGTP